MQHRLHSPLAMDHLALPQLLCIMCRHFHSIFSSLCTSFTSTCYIPFVLREPFLFLACFAPVPFQFIYYAYCALFPITTCTFITPLFYNLKYTSVAYLQRKMKSAPPFQVSYNIAKLCFYFLLVVLLRLWLSPCAKGHHLHVFAPPQIYIALHSSAAA